MNVEREFVKSPPREPLDTLSALVRDFQWRFPRERRDMVVEYCRAADGLVTAIARACRSRNADGKMHNHQSRVPEAVRVEFCNRIKYMIGARKYFDIKDHDFDELYDLVASAVITGIGPVTTYDVATRIGAYLNIEPDSLYLHAGVRQGWIELTEARFGYDIDPSWRNRLRVAKRVWPEALHVLTADELEDFLCTYRSQFRHLHSFT